MCTYITNRIGATDWKFCNSIALYPGFLTPALVLTLVLQATNTEVIRPEYETNNSILIPQLVNSANIV